MIDTDKYKGHTKGPWSDETELYWVMEEDDGSFQVEIDHKPDRLLIHDAPLLLEEVKRLDAIIRDIESLIPENPDYVCEQILGACHRYMHPEEFGEVIE